MEIVEYDKECELCSESGVFRLKWKDGSVLYLCRKHFYELSGHFTEGEGDP